MIRNVIRMKNDMVMVFDEQGEQIPEFQGRYEDVKDCIVVNAPEGTVYNHWFGHYLEPRAVSGETW